MECKVQNANVARVTTAMNRFLQDRYRGVCSCPRCRSDITAIALNYLPPHYYVESVPEQEMGSPWIMVETAVLEAIEIVLERPYCRRKTCR
jgi:hypothetical protein